MCDVLLRGRGCDHIRAITMGKGPIASQCVDVAIQVVDLTAFKLCASPTANLVCRPIVDSKASATSPNLNADPTEHDFVTINALVRIPYDEQVVRCDRHRCSNQLERRCTNVLRLVDDHRPNAK